MATDSDLPTAGEAALVGVTAALNWLLAETQGEHKTAGRIDVAILNVLRGRADYMADALERNRRCVKPIVTAASRMLNRLNLTEEIDRQIDLELIRTLVLKLFRPWTVVEWLCRYDCIED